MRTRTKFSLFGMCLNGLVNLTQIPGLIYSVSNFMIYITSYFSHKGTPLSSVETETLYFLSYGTRCLTIMPGVWLAQHYRPKVVALIGSFFVALSHLAVGFIDTPSVIILFYGVIFGLSTGVLVAGNMTLSLHFLPENPGLASGINSCLFGIGSLIFNSIGTLVINPHNLKPSDPSVAEAMPLMFQAIFYTCVGIILLSVFLIENIPGVPPEEVPQITLWNSFKSREFWLMCFCFSLTTVAPVYIVQKYKDIANFLDVMSDQPLAILGSIGALLSSFGKLFFGQLNDMFGFKFVYTMIIVQVLVVGALFNFGADNSWAFAGYICVSNVSLGGHYTILLPICRKLYGKITGLRVWGVLYMTIAIGTFFAFDAQILVPTISAYAFLINVMSGFAILALGLMIVFREIPIYQEETYIPLLNKDNSRMLT